MVSVYCSGSAANWDTFLATTKNQAFTSTTSEIDPEDKFEVKASNTGAAVATLPTPLPAHTKVKDSNGEFVEPKVVYGQMIRLAINTLGSSWVVTYYDASDAEDKTLTFNASGDEIVLVAVAQDSDVDQQGGYVIVHNEGVVVATAP